MPSSHCTILARFFTRWQVLINRRQMPEISGKSVLVPASDNRAVWIIKDAIWGNRRHVADAREIFGMLNIWSCRDSQSCCVNEFWPVLAEKYMAMTYSQWESKIQGSWKFEEGFLFIYFFLTKGALEYTEQVGYMKMKKGARVFPVNNILL